MDKIHRFLIDESNVRGEVVQLEASWQALIATTEYPAPVRQMLGEAYAAVALLSATIKYKGTLVVQVNGGKPLNLLVVQSTSEGHLRGMARWSGDVDAVPATVKDMFGTDATLVITVQPEEGQGERYQSIVNLEGKTLSECLTAYFEQSEQLKTRLELAVGEKSVAGLLVQKLPGEAKDADGWNRASMLAETIQHSELLDLSVEVILNRLFNQEVVRLFKGDDLRFKCSCSQKKVEDMLIGLGKEESEATMKEQGNIEIDCDFCNTHYTIDEVDLARIFSESVVLSSDSLH